MFFGETDKVGRVPRYEALLEYLRKEGAAGATVARGVAGVGANSKIHTAAILRLSIDLPMILTWIDGPGRVERLLPGLRELAGSGIVIVDEVEVAGYGGRRLRRSPPRAAPVRPAVQDVMQRSVVSVPQPSLNRNVAAMSATSLLSDAQRGGDVGPAWFPRSHGDDAGGPRRHRGPLGCAVELRQDRIHWFGDRTGQRWRLAVVGYVLTGLMPLFLALAGSWPVVLGAKLFGWRGRGIRGPVRHAMPAA